MPTILTSASNTIIVKLTEVMWRVAVKYQRISPVLWHTDSTRLNGVRSKITYYLKTQCILYITLHTYWCIWIWYEWSAQIYPWLNINSHFDHAVAIPFRMYIVFIFVYAKYAIYCIWCAHNLDCCCCRIVSALLSSKSTSHMHSIPSQQLYI